MSCDWLRQSRTPKHCKLPDAPVYRPTKCRVSPGVPVLCAILHTANADKGTFRPAIGHQLFLDRPQVSFLDHSVINKKRLSGLLFLSAIVTSMYSDTIKAALTPLERKFFQKLNTPQKIQDYLDSLPINFEKRGETYMSPRRTIAAKTAHCFEGALLAAAALAYHKQKPLLLDLKTAPTDQDHVVALFKQNGYWGAISKTNHAVLRYRDPIYKTVRELALSYFHEYFLKSGQKTLRSYSAPFDLSKYGTGWITAGEELFDMVQALDESRHFPLVPKKNLKRLRKASQFEVETVEAREWPER